MRNTFIEVEDPDAPDGQSDFSPSGQQFGYPRGRKESSKSLMIMPRRALWASSVFDPPNTVEDSAVEIPLPIDASTGVHDGNEETPQSEWTVVWVDDKAFKESSASMKVDLCKASLDGQCKCYKSTDKFLRAFEKKLTPKRETDTMRMQLIIVVSESNYQTLLHAVDGATAVKAVIQLTATPDPDPSDSIMTHGGPIFHCISWDEVLRSIRSVIATYE